MNSQNKTENSIVFSRKNLDKIYSEYNRRALVHPDPLEFLYEYENPLDREIVGLVAASLAYGKVTQILKDVRKVLDVLGTSPHSFINKNSKKLFEEKLTGFKHRFTTGHDMACLLSGIKKIISSHGSLQLCFKDAFTRSNGDMINVIENFVSEISCEFNNKANFLLPHPSNGSACKRLNLFLRWMVRSDDVDPGAWPEISPSLLLIPLDTHMYQICSAAGFTKRNSADLKTVIEITEAFRKINPEDPVKYDFALTRFGIRDELNMHHLRQATKT